MEDLTGKVFGRLTMKRHANITKGKMKGFWYADCQCGEDCINYDVLVNPYNVKYGLTKSCGCLREESMLSVRELGMAKRADKSEKLSSLVKEIPIEVKEWLDKLGNGDMIKGVRRLLWQLTKHKKKEPPKYLRG